MLLKDQYTLDGADSHEMLPGVDEAAEVFGAKQMTMYTVVIDYDPENGSYGATSPDVDDDHNTVIGIGKSADEAVARFRNALEGHFEFLRERGEPIPQPRVTVTMVPAPVLQDDET